VGGARARLAGRFFSKIQRKITTQLEYLCSIFQKKSYLCINFRICVVIFSIWVVILRFFSAFRGATPLHDAASRGWVGLARAMLHVLFKNMDAITTHLEYLCSNVQIKSYLCSNIPICVVNFGICVVVFSICEVIFSFFLHYRGATPLHDAASRGWVGLARAMLDAGADARAAKHQSGTPPAPKP